MRTRIALVLTPLTVAVFIWLPTASSHGSCSTSATINPQGINQMKAVGTRSCGSAHASISVSVFMEYWNGSGWITVGYNQKTLSNASTVSTNVGPQNCTDGLSYRATAVGTSTGHPNSQFTTSPKTC